MFDIIQLTQFRSRYWESQTLIRYPDFKAQTRLSLHPASSELNCDTTHRTYNTTSFLKRSRHPHGHPARLKLKTTASVKQPKASLRITISSLPDILSIYDNIEAGTKWHQGALVEAISVILPAWERDDILSSSRIDTITEHERKLSHPDKPFFGLAVFNP